MASLQERKNGYVNSTSTQNSALSSFLPLQSQPVLPACSCVYITAVQEHEIALPERADVAACVAACLASYPLFFFLFLFAFHVFLYFNTCARVSYSSHTSKCSVSEVQLSGQFLSSPHFYVLQACKRQSKNHTSWSSESNKKREKETKKALKCEATKVSIENVRKRK